MLCFLAAIIGVVVSVWIVERLIGMQKASKTKSLTEIWQEYKVAKEDAKDWYEKTLLSALALLVAKRKGVVGLAAAIIPAIAVMVSAVCGPDWLEIFKEIPRVAEGICRAIRTIID